MDIATIQKRIEQLEKLEQEFKINKEMLKGELENEVTYLEVAEEVKAAVQKRKQIKDEILSKGPNQEVVSNIKSTQEEIGTLKEILSAELTEIYRENQTDEIAGRKFKINAKLLPKKGEFRNDYGQFTPQGE
ncbi:MAG: hypothetical protein WC107_04170 [Patescibacteria group bacterium]